MKKSISKPEKQAKIRRFLTVPTCIWLILAVTLFVLPFVPDAKMVRLKLQWLELGIFAAFSLWVLWQCFKAQISWQSSCINLPILLYAVYNIILCYFSPNQIIAVMEVRRTILCLSIFMVSANMLTPLLQQRLMHVWIAGTGIISVYGILQHYGGIGIIAVPKMDRIMGTSGNPIFFAAHLIVAVPIILSLIKIHTYMRMRVYLTAVLLSVLSAVFFTKTRAAYIALLIGIPAWFLLNDWLKNWTGLRWLVKKKFVIIGIIIGLLGFHVLFSNIFPAHKAINTKIRSFITALAHRQQAHTVIWRDTIRMWSAAPVVGKGLGTFTIYFPDYASDKLKKIWPQKNFIVNDAHNEYLQILAETGVLGLGLFIWIIISFFISGLKKCGFKKGDQSDYKDNLWRIGLLVSAGVLLIQNIFSVDMRFAISAALLFLIIGMIASGSGNVISGSWEKSGFLKWFVFCIAAAVLVFIGRALINPYRLQKKLAAEPDFFEQKILEPTKTLKDLKVLAQQYPDKASVFEKLGWVYAKEKNWAEAIINYKKAAQLNPQLVGAYNNLGNINFTIGKRKTALTYYKKALAIDPNLVDAHMNAGICYYYEGRLRESAEHIKTVIELDPDNAKARSLLKRMTE